MKWIDASERLPDLFDSHERHFKVDDKKADGSFVDSTGNGDIAFELKAYAKYEIIPMSEFSRIKWLDEGEPSGNEAVEEFLKFIGRMSWYVEPDGTIWKDAFSEGSKVPFQTAYELFKKQK